MKVEVSDNELLGILLLIITSGTMTGLLGLIALGIVGVL
jgi:hypothetical protein